MDSTLQRLRAVCAATARLLLLFHFYFRFLSCPYVVTGGLIKCSWCFFRHAFYEFPRPIALKLCHMVEICVYFIMQVQQLGGSPPPQKKKFGGQKHAKFRSISDHFRFDPEYLRNGWRYPKSADVTNYGNSSYVWWKKSGELWSTNGLELHVSLDPLKCTFWQIIFQPTGGAAPRKFYTR